MKSPSTPILLIGIVWLFMGVLMNAAGSDPWPWISGGAALVIAASLWSRK